MIRRRWCSGIMQDSHSCDPGSIPGRRNFFLAKIHNSERTHSCNPAMQNQKIVCGVILGSVAEWSKALVLGTSLSGRGFESHRCHIILHSKTSTFNRLVGLEI